MKKINLRNLYEICENITDDTETVICDYLTPDIYYTGKFQDISLFLSEVKIISFYFTDETRLIVAVDCNTRIFD